jgi:hypothetical protein
MICRLLAERKALPNFFWENRTEQHPPWWNFKSKKILDADRPKRHDSMTAIERAAVATDFRAKESVGDA